MGSLKYCKDKDYAIINSRTLASPVLHRPLSLSPAFSAIVVYSCRNLTFELQVIPIEMSRPYNLNLPAPVLESSGAGALSKQLGEVDDAIAGRSKCSSSWREYSINNTR